MTKRSMIHASLALTALLPLAASAAEPMPEVIRQLLTKADSTFHAHDINPAGWQHWGTLAAGEHERLVVSMSGGKAYKVIGVCDKACSNIDLKLSDGSNNKLVSSDTQPDDFPIVDVRPAQANSYWLDIIMVTCRSSSCAYGVRAYSQ